VRETVSQALMLYGREEAENLRNEILRNAPLSRIEPRQVEQMRHLIRQIARRLRERYSKPRKRQRRGHLDVRRPSGATPPGAAYRSSPPGNVGTATSRRSSRSATSRVRWRGCRTSSCC
jgi:hypothetical protein